MELDDSKETKVLNQLGQETSLSLPAKAAVGAHAPARQHVLSPSAMAGAWPAAPARQRWRDPRRDPILVWPPPAPEATRKYGGQFNECRLLSPYVITPQSMHSGVFILKSMYIWLIIQIQHTNQFGNSIFIYAFDEYMNRYIF